MAVNSLLCLFGGIGEEEVDQEEPQAPLQVLFDPLLIHKMNLANRNSFTLFDRC